MNQQLAHGFRRYQRVCCNKSNDETGGSSKQGGDHQYTEPTHVEAVVGAGDPLTKLLPRRSAGALLNCGFHEFGGSVARGPVWLSGCPTYEM